MFLTRSFILKRHPRALGWLKNRLYGRVFGAECIGHKFNLAEWENPSSTIRKHPWKSLVWTSGAFEKFTSLCRLPCVFAKWYFWTACHKKYTTSKTWFLVLFKFKIPFYVPISSVVNITMLTNKIFTVFEAYFWRTTWKSTWKNLQVKFATCSCTCTNQGFSGMLPYGTRGIFLLS